MANINDSYFDGYYKEIWRNIIPDELTNKEVDFIFSYFNLLAGGKVLDIMCGYGRHAIALAKKGVEVTAVDNLPDYIAEIKKVAERENLPVKAFQTGIINYETDNLVDLVICMGNSLNFFNPEDTSRILMAVSGFLKAGAHLLINTWSLAEIAMKNFKDKTWSNIGNLKFLTDSKFLFHPTRIETQSIIITPDGKEEIKMGIDYIYSINELETMLMNAGLSLKEVYSIPGKKKFTVGEPRAYIIAQKFS